MKRDLLKITLSVILIITMSISLFACDVIDFDNNGKKQSKPLYNPKVYKESENLKILAVGNSYFSSSQVISTFERLLSANGKSNVEVNKVVKGGYQISFFYNEVYEGFSLEPEYKLLKEGEYDILVLSTIYTEEDIAAAGKLKEALKDTRTEIIIFPTENALKEGVTKILTQYYFSCANWQGFLNRLSSNNGFKGGKLGFDHTNEVGGFAGACLLYSRLYDKLPNVDDFKEEYLSNFSDCFPGKTNEEKAESFDAIVEGSLELIHDFDELYSTYK